MSFNSHLQKFSVVHSDRPNHAYLNPCFLTSLTISGQQLLQFLEENKTFKRFYFLSLTSRIQYKDIHSLMKGLSDPLLKSSAVCVCVSIKIPTPQ
jgi:hypothetical protein